jgi:hypothetical protein
MSEVREVRECALGLVMPLDRSHTFRGASITARVDSFGLVLVIPSWYKWPVVSAVSMCRYVYRASHAYLR